MKILFITHDTSRTGAPYVLLQFMSWVKENKKEVFIDCLALKEGSIIEEFKKNSHNFYSLKSWLNKYRVLNFLLRQLNHLLRTNFLISDSVVFKKLGLGKYDLIYANTAVTAQAGISIKSYSGGKSKVLVHIHELPLIINLLIPDFNEVAPLVDHFLAVSKLTEDSLKKFWNISPARITQIYAFSVLRGELVSPALKPYFVVCAAGYVHWRKGDDVFLQVARIVTENNPDKNIVFKWVGEIPFKEKLILEQDIKKLGLQDKVIFLGEKENPLPYINEADIFLLPSREDPFPLVAIEAGMLGKPIICFDKATGISEIIEVKGGFVVPYLNTEKMAEKVVFYYNNPIEREKDGMINKDQFSVFIPENICPKVFQVVESLK